MGQSKSFRIPILDKGHVKVLGFVGETFSDIILFGAKLFSVADKMTLVIDRSRHKDVLTNLMAPEEGECISLQNIEYTTSYLDTYWNYDVVIVNFGDTATISDLEQCDHIYVGHNMTSYTRLLCSDILFALRNKDEKITVIYQDYFKSAGRDRLEASRYMTIDINESNKEAMYILIHSGVYRYDMLSKDYLDVLEDIVHHVITDCDIAYLIAIASEEIF